MSAAKGSVIQPRSRVCASAALVLLSACSAAAAPIQYVIGVDTSSVTPGTPGLLDFQFNPGADTSQAAVAVISKFNAVGGALVFNPPLVTGDVTGDLLVGPLTFTNDTPFNDALQQFTYGSFFSFVLSLSGPALSSPDGTAPSGSTFSLALLDLSQNPIFPNQAGGLAGSVDVTPDGTATANSFPTGPGGPLLVTFQVIPEFGTVPEPGTMLLLGFGAAGLLMLRKILR